MPKELFQFPCPCCGKRIEIDVRTGKARAVDPNERAGPSFDQLLDEQARASERLASMLDEAKQDHGKHIERASELFKKAKQDAERDKRKRPSNPFDLE